MAKIKRTLIPRKPQFITTYQTYDQSSIAFDFPCSYACLQPEYPEHDAWFDGKTISWCIAFGANKAMVFLSFDITDVKSKKYRKTLDKLVAKGYLAGREGEGEERAIDLSENAVRVLVMLDRAGQFGEFAKSRRRKRLKFLSNGGFLLANCVRIFNRIENLSIRLSPVNL